MTEPRALTYPDVGGTAPDLGGWTARPSGYRCHERTVLLGRGQALWEESTASLLEWGVKTRSGFAVEPRRGAGPRVEQDHEYWLIAAVGPLAVREPVRVIAVVDRPDRCGFAYGTLSGHPVSGEEAFVLHRTVDGEVWLTLRSLTRPSRGGWRLLFPALLIAQQWYRRRYERALRP